MGRKSKIEILTENVLKNLRTIRGQVPHQTYSALERRIIASNRTDTLNKINNDIDQVKTTNTENKKTIREIRTYRRQPVPEVRPVEEEERNIINPVTRSYRSSETHKRDKRDLVNPVGAKKRRYTSRVNDAIKFYKSVRYNFPDTLNEFQLYKNIEFIINNIEPDATSATIFYKKKESDDSERIRMVNVNSNWLESYETFSDFLRELESGKYKWTNKWKKNEEVGSDAVDKNEEILIYTYFDIKSTNIAKSGNGESNKCLFKVKGIEETKKTNGKRQIKVGDCGKKSLLEIVNDLEIFNLVDRTDHREFNTVEKIIDFIIKYNLDISIMCNSFLLKKSHRDIINANKKEEVIVGNKKFYGSNILIDDVDLVYLYGNGENKTILYDEFNQHFDVIEELKFDDSVRILLDSKIIKDGEIIFTPRELNLNNKAKNPTELRYLFFDYETVIDFEMNSCMRPYSISILNLNNDELEKLNKADEEGDIETVKNIREEHCVTFLGFDCNEKFIKWIVDNQSNVAFVFIGFNNANFDNFIFLEGLLKYKDTEIGVSEIFYNGTQLLNFYINGRHNTFDIHKHLMGSLKNNCESFKIKCCAKKSFDHHKAQLLFLENELINYISNNEELKEYNEYDVLATAVLFSKYRFALNNIEATKKYSSGLHNIKTVGSLIYKVFEDSKKTKKFDLPKLSFDEYDHLQKSKIAGRVELFNGVQKVEERLVSTDVCSLYPYVMSVAPVYYPCGEKILTNKYVKDKIGFYYCDIDQSNLKGMNLPNIYAKKSEIENDWGYDGVLENYLISNVMIELLLKYNCKVTIKNGFYFTDKMKSCEMFDFILDFMKEKNGEDDKKKNKDPTYNPALRETLKLLMNSLSGKVIEGLHCEKTQSVDTIAEYEKIKSKSKSINFINAIGSKLFVTYEMEEEKLINKQRPIYLGVLIYDYAKSYMFNYSYSKVGKDQLLYTDTDASKFRYKRFIEWKEWVDENNVQVPHWEEVEKVDIRYKNHKIFESDSKVFGSFEDELEDMVGDEYKFYCVEKKSWCYSVDGKSKYRFKGLNGSALLLSLGEDFVEAKTINHKTKLDKEGWIETKYYIKPNSEIYVNNFNNDNKHLSIDNNTAKFFEQIYSTNEAYVLCNSFRKIVKNSARNVSIDDKDKYNSLMNKIQVNYIIKKINLKK